MSKRKRDLEKLATMIVEKLQEGLDYDDEEEIDDEDTFHLVVKNVNEDDLDYILITPNQLTISTRPGVYEPMDEIVDFLEDNFDEYPD